MLREKCFSGKSNFLKNHNLVVDVLVSTVHPGHHRIVFTGLKNNW